MIKNFFILIALSFISISSINAKDIDYPPSIYKISDLLGKQESFDIYLTDNMYKENEYNINKNCSLCKIDSKDNNGKIIQVKTDKYMNLSIEGEKSNMPSITYKANHNYLYYVNISYYKLYTQKNRDDLYEVIEKSLIDNGYTQNWLGGLFSNSYYNGNKRITIEKTNLGEYEDNSNVGFNITIDNIDLNKTIEKLDKESSKKENQTELESLLSK